MPYAKGTIQSIRHVHGDLCKYLGIDSSTDPEDMSFFLFLANYRPLSARILIWGITFLSLYPCTSHHLVSYHRKVVTVGK